MNYQTKKIPIKSEAGVGYMYPHIQTDLIRLETSSSLIWFQFQFRLSSAISPKLKKQWITTSGTSLAHPTVDRCTEPRRLLLRQHLATLCTDLRDTRRSVNKAATANRSSLRRRETLRFTLTLLRSLLLLHVSLVWSQTSGVRWYLCDVGDLLAYVDFEFGLSRIAFSDL